MRSEYIAVHARDEEHHAATASQAGLDALCGLVLTGDVKEHWHWGGIKQK